VLRPPLEVQQPERVARLPDSMPGGMVFQAKLDGWRCLAFIDEDAVILQARSKRLMTDEFPEILPALATLPAGTVLDGEVCAIRDGVFDFHALRSAPRARAAAGVAVSFVAFDILADAGEKVTDQPLEQRWARLLARLRNAPTGLETVMSTGDRDQAEQWLETLAPVGIEGIVAKDLGAPYEPGVGHGWVKLRHHGDTLDAELLGPVGPANRPTALRVRLEDGRELVTLGLDHRAWTQLAKDLAEAHDTPIRLEVRVTATGKRTRTEFVRVRPADA
jgi:ATP-dependent DNA ligase